MKSGIGNSAGVEKSIGSVVQPSLKDLDYSILQKCMHCGLCLPTCPTYEETKLERHGPRGRIKLMRSIADGTLEVDKSFADEMYFCLGGLACETSCPAGVDYSHIFETARAEIESKAVISTPMRRLWRWLTLRFLFQNPRTLRFAGRLLFLIQALGIQSLARKLHFTKLLPRDLRALEPSTPDISPVFSDALIQQFEKPEGKVRFRVGMLTGCMQDLLFSNVNRDTVDVLLENGCEVFTPRNQMCCGSLHSHNGEPGIAADLARRLLKLFNPENLDAIISNAGGCGSHLKSFGSLLADDPEFAKKARIWDAKVFDIHEWLDRISWSPPTSSQFRTNARITYHESCHLCHGQKITRQPRDILRSIPGVEFIELKESDLCCGSAGIYNITQPVMAGKLLKRKIERIQESNASVVATSNPGCHLQIQSGLQETGSNASVLHTMTILAMAYKTQQINDPT